MRSLLVVLSIVLGTTAIAQVPVFTMHEPAPTWRHLLRAKGPAIPISDLVPTTPPVSIIGAYSYDRLGVFCKAEYHLHQWLPIPVLIRLGDVERDEEVDGKGAYRKDW